MPLRFTVALAALLLAAPATPALATDHEEPFTVESVQSMLVTYFGLGRSTIHNWQGVPGEHKSWDMVRKVDSATTVRRCFTQLQVPTVLSKRNSSPVTYFGFDWKDMKQATVSGSRITFTAKWMAADESAELTVESNDRAEQLKAAFDFLRDNCQA